MRQSFVRLTLIIVAAAVIEQAAAASVEEQVRTATRASGVTVVHLWAPWCPNCLAELKSGGWSKEVAANPQVKFLFVSMWNGGIDGHEMLAKYHVAEQPNVIVLADPRPRGSDRVKQFLDLPLIWIPTTWIFKGGELRYAMNYGEMRFPILQQLIDDTRSDWSR